MTPADASAPSTRPPLLERLALHRPALRAWAMYDWANSAMWTVVITAVFPVFYENVAAAGLSEDAVRRQFSLVTTVCMAVAALLGPILGAVADYARMKKKLFGVFFGLGVATTAALYFVHRGEWVLAAVLFGLANIGIASSFVFYDSMLPHIASPEEADRLSTTGFAAGYLGGGLCLAICAALIFWEVPLGLAGADGLSARVGFVVVAVWWLVFTLPYFFRVPEPPLAIEVDERAGQNPVRMAFLRIGETLGELKRYRQAFVLLVAFLLYSDGIGTINRMAALYATALHIPSRSTVLYILLVQFIGVPFAILFGRLADKIGAKRGILIALAGYIGICVWASRITETWEFAGICVLVGMVQGGAQALSRSLFSTLIPKHKSGEFFGLFSTLDKFAGILGPLVFGLAPSVHAAVLWVTGFFIVGAAILALVDVEEGRRAAVASEADLVGRPST
jgi:UMF1 family MFS transporter